MPLYTGLKRHTQSKPVLFLENIYTQYIKMNIFLFKVLGRILSFRGGAKFGFCTFPLQSFHYLLKICFEGLRNLQENTYFFSHEKVQNCLLSLACWKCLLFAQILFTNLFVTKEQVGKKSPICLLRSFN